MLYDYNHTHFLSFNILYFKFVTWGEKKKKKTCVLIKRKGSGEGEGDLGGEREQEREGKDLIK